MVVANCIRECQRQTNAILCTLIDEGCGFESCWVLAYNIYSSSLLANVSIKGLSVRCDVTEFPIECFINLCSLGEASLICFLIKSTSLSGFDLMTSKNRFWSKPLNPFMSLPSNYSDSITFASILFLLHLVERGMIQWNSCKLLMTMSRPLGLKINELIPFAIFRRHCYVICSFESKAYSKLKKKNVVLTRL